VSFRLLLFVILTKSNLSSSTQKILKNARLAEQGVMVRDPIRESIGLELDMINILQVVHSVFHDQKAHVSA